MNSADIEAFLAVFQYGTMTAAAESLYITQPTLSNRIKSLEREVGVTLFKRGKGQGRSELTESGQRFALLAQRWYQLMKDVKDISKAEKHEHLRIGAVFTTNQFILPAVYQRFLRRGLPVTLNAHTLQSFGLTGAQAVTHREMDMAFVDSDVMQTENLELIPIIQEPMVFFCAPDSDYPELVDVSKLDAEKEIQIIWQKDISAWHDRYFGTDAKPMMVSDSLQVVSTMPHLSDLWAVVPLSAATHMAQAGKGKVCRMNTPPPDRFTYLVTRKGEPLSEAAELFLEDLISVLEQEEQVQLLLGRGIVPYSAMKDHQTTGFDW